MGKIGICGVHGTGKTTLAKYLVKHLREFDYYPEFAREIINNRKGFNWRETIVEDPIEYMLFEAGIAAAYSLQSVVSNFIADRTPLDIKAYISLMVSKLDKSKFNSEYINLLNSLISGVNRVCDTTILNTKYDIVICLEKKVDKDTDYNTRYIHDYITNNISVLDKHVLLFYEEKPNLDKVLEEVMKII